jgi:hypothetical protein
MGHTTFSLVYRSEAMLSTEVKHNLSMCSILMKSDQMTPESMI